MNGHKPDWYERMKGDPFARKTFTPDSIDAIEIRVAEEHSGGRNGRKLLSRIPALAAMACAAVLLAAVVMNTGGTSWWKDTFRTVASESPSPAGSPTPSPDATQSTNPDTLADEAWRITPEQVELYESFAEKKSDVLLKDLEPMDVFKLYVFASERGDYESQHALFIQGEHYATPSLEEFLKDMAADPEGAARSKEQWAAMKSKYRLKQEISGDSAYIVMSDGSGSPEGERTFSLTRNKEGIWKVNWLPMQ